MVYFKVAALLGQLWVGAAVYATVLAFMYPDAPFLRLFLGLALAVSAIQMVYLVLHLCASFLASRNLRFLVFAFSAAVVVVFTYGVSQAFVQSHLL